MWSSLRARRLFGYKFRRQHPVGRFILDFYCAEKRLALEIDGPTHSPGRDARRDRLLNSAGIKVVRIGNEDVYERLEDILGLILEELEARPSYASSSGRTRIPRDRDAAG